MWCGKKCPKHHFQPNLCWVGLALGLGVLRFNNNIQPNRMRWVTNKHPNILLLIHTTWYRYDTTGKYTPKHEWQIRKYDPEIKARNCIYAYMREKSKRMADTAQVRFVSDWVLHRITYREVPWYPVSRYVARSDILRYILYIPNFRTDIEMSRLLVLLLQ